MVVKEDVTVTRGGQTVDVEVWVVVVLMVEVEGLAVTVVVGLTATIFFVYVIWMYLVPKSLLVCDKRREYEVGRTVN